MISLRFSPRALFVIVLTVIACSGRLSAQVSIDVKTSLIHKSSLALVKSALIAELEADHRFDVVEFGEDCTLWIEGHGATQTDVSSTTHVLVLRTPSLFGKGDELGRVNVSCEIDDVSVDSVAAVSAERSRADQIIDTHRFVRARLIELVSLALPKFKVVGTFALKTGIDAVAPEPQRDDVYRSAIIGHELYRAVPTLVQSD